MRSPRLPVLHGAFGYLKFIASTRITRLINGQIKFLKATISRIYEQMSALI